MSKATADWKRVGDRFYRSIRLYTDVFAPDLELENYIVVGAPYSGAVALYRDESKIFAPRGSQAVGTKATIDLYSCAGRLIRQIPRDRGALAAVGWSEDERLLVVGQDGEVRSYADLGTDFTPFSLGHEAEEYGVKSCRFWGTGFVALLGNNRFVAVTRYDEPRPQALASAPPGEVISWAVVPPEYTSSRSVEVLLAVGRTVHVVDAAESEDRGLQAGPFRHIAVSPNGKFIALYTDDGKVWVISSDFQERFSEYDSRVKTPPKDLQWCGNNAVVLAWEDEIHLVGPSGSATSFEYDGFVHLVPDVDGIRVMTNDVCDFWQKVPDACEEVWRLGSSSPASVLVDAVEMLEKKSAKADENIQLIRGNLDEAVNVCVRAAGQEYSVHRQKQLLKAASFGKSVLELYNSDDYVDMTEVLRVLNAVRFYEIGVPVSYDQYIRLTPERLVQRLVNRQEYLLALKISEFLRLPVDKIYVAWARQKVRSSSTDEESICEEIVRKLNGQRGISFEEVAHAAYEDGRGSMAIQLLEHEPRAGKQVPLLLSLGEEGGALDKAIDSGDTDLIFWVLLNLKKKMPLSTFFRTINSRPVASAIVEASAIEQDQEVLKDLYYQDDRRVDGSNLLLSEALSASDTNGSADKLKMAAKLLRDSKDHAPQVAALEDAQKLLKFQEAFERDLQGESFVGLSVNETMGKLVRLGHGKRGMKVKEEFKVGEKGWAWVRLRALVGRREWRELEELSKGRKSAIGWEPYFNEILGAGNPKVAALFIPKCTNLAVNERIEMWLKCGLVKNAAEEALKAKDREKLEELRGKASGQGVVEVERMINLLGRGR
ncbi:Vacuolar protein sorting-associated protein 16 [Saxophila tyrrhenica]|uniref:Probable vacuolar protein sorting-associated protein 16 homolog n=1 Tax=Saxophila tyrrhenica TaxID=1690608 RepID=A0AAV9P7U2_9PEZI|nr:Vacuolar protein sorting-associated protein 16 [Saxophila tyrrhenica]